MGVSAKGKIVIARYYHSGAASSPRSPAEHGAVGCLIFSDPHEDGFVQGETFPLAPGGRKTGVQRGSVADMPFYPGDPLTRRGRHKKRTRLKIEEADDHEDSCATISYADAQPLSAALTGRLHRRTGAVVSPDVRIGPARQVHLKVKSNGDQPAYDVMRKLRARLFPTKWVIRGTTTVAGSMARRIRFPA